MIFKIKIDPVPKARARVTSRGFSYTPKKTKDFERNFLILASIYKPMQPLTGALKVTLEFGIVAPKRPKSAFPVTRPDLDNYIKSVLDALNGHFWVDDSQVVSLSASKYYSIEGHIRVKIETVANVAADAYSSSE